MSYILAISKLNEQKQRIERFKFVYKFVFVVFALLSLPASHYWYASNPQWTWKGIYLAIRDGHILNDPIRVMGQTFSHTYSTPETIRSFLYVSVSALVFWGLLWFLGWVFKVLYLQSSRSNISPTKQLFNYDSNFDLVTTKGADVVIDVPGLGRKFQVEFLGDEVRYVTRLDTSMPRLVIDSKGNKASSKTQLLKTSFSQSPPEVVLNGTAREHIRVYSSIKDPLVNIKLLTNRFLDMVITHCIKTDIVISGSQAVAYAKLKEQDGYYDFDHFIRGFDAVLRELEKNQMNAKTNDSTDLFVSSKSIRDSFFNTWAIPLLLISVYVILFFYYVSNDAGMVVFGAISFFVLSMIFATKSKGVNL